MAETKGIKPIPTDWFKALRYKIPTISFDVANSLWQEAAVLDPQLESKSDDEVATKLSEAATRASSLTKIREAGGSYSPTDIPTSIKGPYAGTTQEEANPQFPNASSISQFDPAAANAAQADYERRYAESAPRRQVSQFISGQAPGAAWQALDKENYERTIGHQKRLQEQATAGQAAATSAQSREKEAGEFAASQREKQQKLETGQFGVDQQRRINDPNSTETKSLKAMIPDILAKGNIDAQAKRQLLAIVQDPNSTAAQLAPIISTLAPEAMKAWLDNIKGRTGEQEVRSKTATADIDVGMRDAILGKPTAPAQPPAQGTTESGVPTPPAQPAFPQMATTDSRNSPDRFVKPGDQMARDQERLRVLKQEYEREQDPGAKMALQREIIRTLRLLKPFEGSTPTPTTPTPQAATPPAAQPMNELQKRLPFSSIQGAGQTLSPDPRVVAGAAAEAGAGAKAEERFRAYDTELAPTITAIREKMKTLAPGKGTEYFARVLPGESRELVNLFNRFNALYPGTLQGGLDQGMAQSVAKEGFTGSLVTNLTTDQVNRMLQLIEGSASKDRGYQRGINAGRDTGTAPGQYGANQPMPSTTPPAPATGLPRVSSRAEFEALPRGTRFFNTVTNKEQEKL